MGSCWSVEVSVGLLRLWRALRTGRGRPGFSHHAGSISCTVRRHGSDRRRTWPPSCAMCHSLHNSLGVPPALPSMWTACSVRLPPGHGRQAPGACEPAQGGGGGGVCSTGGRSHILCWGHAVPQHEAQTGQRDLLVVRSTQGRREEKCGLQVLCGDCGWDRLGLVCVLRMEEHEAPPPPAVLNFVMSLLPCKRRCDAELHQRTHTRTHMHTQIKPHHSHRAGWRALRCLTEHYTH